MNNNIVQFYHNYFRSINKFFIFVKSVEKYKTYSNRSGFNSWLPPIKDEIKYTFLENLEILFEFYPKEENQQKIKDIIDYNIFDFIIVEYHIDINFYNIR